MKSTVEILIEENQRLRSRFKMADTIVMISVAAIAVAAVVGWLK